MLKNNYIYKGSKANNTIYKIGQFLVIGDDLLLKKNKVQCPVLSWDKCIAKTNSKGNPSKTVKDHAYQTAAVCKLFLQYLPEPIRKLVSDDAIALAAIHDVGKISPGFQKKILGQHVKNIIPGLLRFSLENFVTDHALTGAIALDAYFQNKYEASDYAQIISLHHGDFKIFNSSSNIGSIYGGTSWANERKKFLSNIFDSIQKLDNKKIAPFLRYLFTGIVTISDWIASDEKFFIKNDGYDFQAQNALHQCGFIQLQFRENLTFKDIFEFSPYPNQKKFIKRINGPGLYILEAEMGSGKTEIALYTAYKLMSEGYHHGFFFGLPTRLTSNKIIDRVEPFIEKILTQKIKPKLAHGQAWLEEYDKGGEGFSAGMSWFNPRKRMMLHPFTVGTIDQALLGILRVKHFFLRTLGLAGKIVILDEVHSYDMYTGSLLEELVQQLLELKCTVIILSATLTHEKKLKFHPQYKHINMEYPQLTVLTKSHFFIKKGTVPPPKTYKIRIKYWNDQKIIEKAVQRAQNGNCVLCICNTVDKAQSWYKRICATTTEGEFPVGLLHSRFPGFKRKELEDKWITCLGKEGNRPEGCILVSTQIVEQSVDIDADVLITELAPTDMLVQRMGRQWRHNIDHRQSDEPETFIVLPASPENAHQKLKLLNALGGPSCYVYSPYILWRTWQIWKSLVHIKIPQDIRLLLEKTYSKHEPENIVIAELLNNHNHKIEKLNKLALANSIHTESLLFEDNENIFTRYTEYPSLQVILVKSLTILGKYTRLKLLDNSELNILSRPEKRQMIKLYQNMITLPRYLLPENVQAPTCFNYFFHEPTPVLVWDREGGHLIYEGENTAFGYTHELGAFKTQIQKIDHINDPVDEMFDIIDNNW